MKILPETIERIKKHEGYVPEVYLDSVGVPTAGYGHAFIVGSKIPKEVSDILFLNDLNNCVEDYAKLNLNLDPARESVMIEMLYNLGLTKLLKFKATLAAIRKQAWDTASANMLKSKWRLQVGQRAETLAKIMKTGEWDGKRKTD